MENKLPYYVAYPMPLLYDDEKRDRMDFEYMKSMYPETAKRMLPYVEEECDRMEYDGSMMFDEYPDPLQMTLMGRRVFDKAQKEQMIPESECIIEEPNGRKENRIRDLIQVMLYQEIYKRRCDHRKYSRKYYSGAGL